MAAMQECVSKKRAREAEKPLDTSPSLHKSSGLMQRRGSLAHKAEANVKAVGDVVTLVDPMLADNDKYEVVVEDGVAMDAFLNQVDAAKNHNKFYKAPAANCTAWHAAGECDTNPNFVMHQCSDMCGLCDTVCADQFDMCLEWAAGGQCEANRAFMYRNCPASCALCARVRRAGMHGAKARRSGQGDAARESLPEKTEL
jgi:hypothetical protein